MLELVHWWRLRNTKERFPEYIRYWRYWVITVAMIIASGFLCLLYFGDRGQALVVFHVGVSAPLIIQKLATQMANPGARSGRMTIVSDFFVW